MGMQVPRNGWRSACLHDVIESAAKTSEDEDGRWVGDSSRSKKILGPPCQCAEISWRNGKLFLWSALFPKFSRLAFFSFA